MYYLVELSVTDGKADLPAGVGLSIMDDGLLAFGVANVHRLSVQIDILFETLDRNARAVQVHADALNATSHVIDTLLNQRFKVIVHLCHVEFRQIRLKRDTGVLLAGAVGSDFRFAFDRHVVAKDLTVLQLALLVGSFDNKFRAEDIAEFGTVTVTTARHFLFVIVIIGRSQEVTKDELGHVDLLLLVDCNRDTLAVVVD